MAKGNKVLWPDGNLSVPRVTSEFGPRTSIWTGSYWTSSYHNGIDLVGWSIIKAPVTGVVTFSGYNGGAGYEVRIREDGTGDVYRLLHNRELWVKTGDRVTQGQSVAVMGTTGASTGVHCHYETRPGGGAAVNPRTFMRNRNAAAAAGGGDTPTPNKRKRKKMSLGVIHTTDAADENRSGAIVDFEAGTFSPFGWFSVSYANGVAKGFGLEASAPVTRGHYNQIKKDIAARAAAMGKVFVDIADEDVPKIGG